MNQDQVQFLQGRMALLDHVGLATQIRPGDQLMWYPSQGDFCAELRVARDGVCLRNVAEDGACRWGIPTRDSRIPTKKQCGKRDRSGVVRVDLRRFLSIACFDEGFSLEFLDEEHLREAQPVVRAIVR